MVTLRPYWYWGGVNFATHGSPHDSDANVPIVFYGAGIKAGRNTRRALVVDIAPTLAAIVGVRPMEATGRSRDSRGDTTVAECSANNRQPRPRLHSNVCGFGPLRTLNVRASKLTGQDSAARVEAWLRSKQVELTGEVLVITGRGAGSLDGIPVVKEATQTRAEPPPSSRCHRVVRRGHAGIVRREPRAASFAARGARASKKPGTDACSPAPRYSGAQAGDPGPPVAISLLARSTRLV